MRKVRARLQKSCAVAREQEKYILSVHNGLPDEDAVAGEIRTWAH